MDRLRLLPMELPFAGNINGSGIVKGRISFMRRLALGFVILAVLGLLYVPAYHSAQGPFLNLGETPLPARTLSSSHLIASMVQLPGWTYNTTRDLKVYIQPDVTTTILSPVGLCSPSPPYLIIVVCSAIPNQKSRMAIRNTWAGKENLDNSYNSTIKVTFLLGESDNNTLNNFVAEESSLYNDIIQEKFLDTYNNLTLKSVMMLKWMTSNCNEARYLMKTDDDMFINVPPLLDVLHSRSQTTDVLLGSLICNAKPILDPKNKWYTPKYMYPDRVYPNYLSGTGYVMSLGVAMKLYNAALSTALLHLEDVYITGVCAKRAKVRPINHAGFSYVPRKIDPCILQSAITAHKVSASNMYVVWKTIRNSHSCNNRSIDVKKATGEEGGSSSVSSFNRNARNLGYYIVKRRVVSRCA